TGATTLALAGAVDLVTLDATSAGPIVLTAPALVQAQTIAIAARSVSVDLRALRGAFSIALTGDSDAIALPALAAGGSLQPAAMPSLAALDLSVLRSCSVDVDDVGIGAIALPALVRGSLSVESGAVASIDAPLYAHGGFFAAGEDDALLSVSFPALVDLDG